MLTPWCRLEFMSLTLNLHRCAMVYFLSYHRWYWCCSHRCNWNSWCVGSLITTWQSCARTPSTRVSRVKIVECCCCERHWGKLPQCNDVCSCGSSQDEIDFLWSCEFYHTPTPPTQTQYYHEPRHASSHLSCLITVVLK